MEKKYWPFEVVPPERRSPRIAAQIEFLETAYHEGWKPYEYSFGYSAGVDGGRAASIIWRSTPRLDKWEIMLCTPEKKVLSAFISGFQHAAQAALHWLRNESVEAILVDCKDHLFRPSGAKRSYTIHGEE